MLLSSVECFYYILMKWKHSKANYDKTMCATYYGDDALRIVSFRSHRDHFYRCILTAFITVYIVIWCQSHIICAWEEKVEWKIHCREERKRKSKDNAYGI